MSERSLVRDLMRVGVPTCAPDTPIVDLARRLLEKNLEALVVLDAEGHAVGVVGQDDLVRAYTRDDYSGLTAEDIMSENVPQVPADIPLKTAAQIMRDLGARAVFLMHHSGGVTYPAAVLTYIHLLRHLAASDDNELADLGIQASRQRPLDKFIEKRDAAREAARRASHLPDEE